MLTLQVSYVLYITTPFDGNPIFLWLHAVGGCVCALRMLYGIPSARLPRDTIRVCVT